MTVAIEHPIRRVLNDELHARKFNNFDGTGRFIRYVYFTQGDDKLLMRHVNEMLVKLKLPEMAADVKFVRLEADGYAIRVERHTEFMSVSLIDIDEVSSASVPKGAFDESAYPHLPFQLIRDLKHPLFHAMWLEISNSPARKPNAASMEKILQGRAVAGSQISSGGGQLYCSFDIDDADYSRMVLFNKSIAGHRMGRVIQRAIEMETYRLIALLSLPKVKQFSPVLDRIEENLRKASSALSKAHQINEASQSVEEADKLLASLTSLAAELEQVYAETSYRFSAGNAYQEIVTARLFALSTQRLDGFQSIRGFLDKRMMPAMQSANAFSGRMERLSRRIAYAGQLQRSQTELALQKQNRDLLMSMNKRTSAQLRLQQTVEGLSIAAVTYYGVGLVGYFANGFPLADWGIDLIVLKTIAVPVIAFLVWRNIRHVSDALQARKAPD